jgi:dTDP-4-amino-4,6-dideoxygalactose transaminase
MRMLRDWGQEKKYHHVLPGYNYRMEGFQGAVLRVKLKYLEAWTEARRSHAKSYDDLLAGSKVVQAPQAMSYARHVYHVYAVRSANRDGLQAKLQEKGIQTGIHYPIPVHLQPAYSSLGYGVGDFPQAERAANEVLSLPMFPELTRAQIDSVVDAIKS